MTAPNLANDDFNRIRNLRLERLRQMKDHAGAIAERAFARVLYGSHPYGHLSLGSEPALTAMTVDDARAHARRDVHARRSRRWSSSAIGPKKSCSIAAPRCSNRGARRLADDDRSRRGAGAAAGGARRDAGRGGAARRGAIGAAHRPRVRAAIDAGLSALLILNTILGGEFVSRLNLNLREAKGYTYGVRTGFNLRRGIGPFVMQTSVGTDVTASGDSARPAPRFAPSPTRARRRRTKWRRRLRR